MLEKSAYHGISVGKEDQVLDFSKVEPRISLSQGFSRDQTGVLGSAIRVGNSKPNWLKFTKSLRLRRNSVSIPDLMDAQRIYPAQVEANPMTDLPE